MYFNKFFVRLRRIDIFFSMECDEAKLEEAQNSEKWSKWPKKQVLNLKFNFLQFLLSSVNKYKLTWDIKTQSSE